MATHPPTPIRSTPRNASVDHGDVTLVEVDGKKIYVELSGACRSCSMEAAALAGVQQKLIEALGELVQVLPVGAMANH